MKNVSLSWNTPLSELLDYAWDLRDQRFDFYTPQFTSPTSNDYIAGNGSF